MEVALDIGIGQGFFDLETLSLLYQTSKSLHRSFECFSVSLEHYGRSYTIQVTNYETWYALFTAFKCQWVLKSQTLWRGKDLTEVIRTAIMLLALGFIDLAMQLKTQADISDHWLVVGAELNGSTAVYDACIVFNDAFAALYMQFAHPPLFSDAQFLASRLLENWRSMGIFENTIFLFIERIANLRSIVGLRFLLKKLKQSPPVAAECSTWEGYIKRTCSTCYDLERVQNLQAIYSVWKVPEAEALLQVLNSLEELIKFKTTNEFKEMLKD